MSSPISKILMGYRKSLDISQEDYEEEFRRRINNLEKYYDAELKRVIRVYDRDFESSFLLDRLTRSISSLSGGKKLYFAAVDGTCWKQRMEPYVVFFSASYAIRGRLRVTFCIAE